MQESNQNVLGVTTAFFAGFHAIVDPAESWIAKWLQLRNAKPGVYASEVHGTLPPDAQAMCEAKGYKWRCKAGAA
jgi:hypothetical protein